MLKHFEIGSTCILEPTPSGDDGTDAVKLPAGAFKTPELAPRLFEPGSKRDVRLGAPVWEEKRFAEVFCGCERFGA